MISKDQPSCYKDKTELVNGFSIAEFSKDGKAVLYTNSNNVLYRYDIKKKKHTKIASNVETFYCDEKSCDEMNKQRASSLNQA